MHTRLSVAAAKRWMALGKLQFIISCFLVCLPLLLLIAIAINFVILESFSRKVFRHKTELKYTFIYITVTSSIIRGKWFRDFFPRFPSRFFPRFPSHQRFRLLNKRLSERVWK